MASSSDTGVSDTLDPMAIPFALPDVGAEPADGLPARDLPLAVIPAPIPLAAYLVVDMPLDVVFDDDIDLFEEDPPEADHEGGAPIAADVILPIADAPAEEGVQHHSHDADPDMASSAAPAPAHDLEFDHAVDDDFDPVFPPGFDPDQDIEFIHLDQPIEEPPAVAPEPLAAPDPALEHDPAHDDAPAIAPFIDDIPIVDHPVVAPPLVDDHVVDAPVDAPLLIEDPVVAPFPDPVPVLFDHAPFATHIDPRYADTRNGWIDDDGDYPPFVLSVTPPAAPVLAPVSVPVSAPISAPTDTPLFPPHITDAHRTDLPFTFLQDIPPPRPGEGSSRQPPVPVPPILPITEAIDLSVALTEEVIRLNKFSNSEQKKKETHVESSGENKTKFSNFKQGTSNVNKKGKACTPARAATGAENKGNGYMGTLPKCNTCQRHHS
ncbi:proline-rich protein 36-like [Helianthus annuus]|uniref:proline-rich protein 36-like n=1 Tax=Helianthus annuus TaxID=4232 RepID=UPI001652BFCF|nr:proline-rich protein 36-like [Helianthus annuus]